MTTTLTDRLNNAFAGGSAIKAPVRVASTGNLTLSGYQTVDGIAVGSSDATADANMRILVKNQTNSSANGIYQISNSAWSRTRDFDGSKDVNNGTLVWVSTGASQGGGFYNVTNSDPVTPDTSTAITFAAADVFVATAAASSAAAFAACAYVAAGSAYVAAASAAVAAGSAITAASSASAFASCAYVAAGSAYVAANSAYVAAGSAYVAANSAYVAAGSAYVAAGCALTAAGSAVAAAGSAITAASSAASFASCAYIAASCAYVAAGCAAAGGDIGAGSTGWLAFYSSAVTPVVVGTSAIVYNSAGGLALGASGVTAGSLTFKSTGADTTIRGSTAAIAYTLAFPSSLGSSGQVVQLNAGGLLAFITPTAGLSGAAQSDQETASSSAVAVTPAVQHFHPGHPKCWITWSGSAISESYNVTSAADDAGGKVTTTIATDFSTTTYAVIASALHDSNNRTAVVTAVSSGTNAVMRVLISTQAGEDGITYVAMLGDHA